MPGPTSGQKLTALDFRVLGFIQTHVEGVRREDVHVKLDQANFLLNRSIDKLVALNKIEFDAQMRFHASKKPVPASKKELKLPLQNMHREDAANAKALRAALSSTYPQLRKAAVEVMRGVFLRETAIGERARLLGLSLEAFRMLRRDFPEYCEDAEHRIGY